MLATQTKTKGKTGSVKTQKKKTEAKPPAVKPVHVAFPQKKGKEARTQTAGSPFQPAKLLKKRLKLFIWGDTGVGKTMLALQFPGVVVIDAEGGTDLYGDHFDFDVLHTTDPDRIMQSINWLAGNSHNYRTLVVDPITIYWDGLQKKWSDIFLQRNRGSKGYKFEYYDLQVKDWQTIKAEFKQFVRRLIALDMNVIVTARSKTKYKDGGFMQVAGQTFDGEKSLPYMFDIVLQMYLDEKNRHMARVLKDRSNGLPKEDFEAQYPLFKKLFGKSLTRKANGAVRVTEEERPEPKVEPVKTEPEKAEPQAGQPGMITGEEQAHIVQMCRELGLNADQVRSRLVFYGVSRLSELSGDNARVIIDKLQVALANKHLK